MLSAVMYGKQDIRVEEREKPRINKNEVLLKVKSVGICGTDLRIYRNGLPSIYENSPRVLGHEFSGVIEEVGEDVMAYRKGMRVAVAPNIGCGVCDTCVRGDEHLCKDYQAIGVHLDGGFAEYMKIPEAAIQRGNVTIIPNHISFEEASILEPLSCVYNGFERCSVRPGDTVLIIGAGPIGIMHAKFAKLAGASKVILSNRSTQRLEIAKEIDDSYITIPESVLKERILEMTNDEGVDVCIIACSSPEAQSLSVELVRMDGRINFFGGLPKGKEQIQIDSNIIHYKQVLLTGTTKANTQHFRKTLEFVSTGLLKVDDLITKKFKIKDTEQALNEAMNSTGIKTLIVFD